MDGDYTEFQGTALEELSRALLAEQDTSAAMRTELGRKNRELDELKRELQDLRAWNSIGASSGREDSGLGPPKQTSYLAVSSTPSPVQLLDACVGRSRVAEGQTSQEVAVGDSTVASAKPLGISTPFLLRNSSEPTAGVSVADSCGKAPSGARSENITELASLRARNALLESQVHALRRQALQAETAVRILTAGFKSSLSTFADLAARITAVSRRVRRVDASVGRLLRLQRTRRRGSQS